MPQVVGLLLNAWSFINGSAFFWRFVKNYGTLKNSLLAVEAVFQSKDARGDKTPNSEEAQILLQAVSNILKSGLIDFPGVDEYEIGVGLEQLSGQIHLSMTDSKGNAIIAAKILNVKKAVDQ